MTRYTSAATAVAVLLAVPAAADQAPRRQRSAPQQERGAEVTEQFSTTVRLGRGGALDVTNIAGDVVITGGSGADVRVDAVKRARAFDDAAARMQLQAMDIEVVELSNRVEVQTRHRGLRRRDRRGTVDYTISVPQDAAVTVQSVSGSVTVTNVRGELRAETVSGDVTLRGLKARAIDARSVSGTLRLGDIESGRVNATSVTGDVEYGGGLARSGRYEFASHAGNILLNLSGNTGFDVEASTFSGDVRSDYALTLRGGTSDAAPPPLPPRPRGGVAPPGRPGRLNRGVRTLRGSFGEGGASVELQSFSGDIAITRK
jgi:hypothetical protein